MLRYREISRRSRLDLAIVIGLTMLALLTRAYGLGDWSFWGDEYFTFYNAADRADDPVNPAYYALVVASFKLFGVSEWSARFPAMILGVLAAPVFYLTWRHVIGWGAAIIGALIIIASIWHLDYSQAARFYSGVFLFGSLSFYLYFRALQLDSMRHLIAALVATLVGITFHMTFVMVGGACFIFTLFVLARGVVATDGLSRRIARSHLIICLAVGILALPFLWTHAEQWKGTGQTWGYGPLGVSLQMVKYVQLPVAVAAAFGLLMLLQREFTKGVFFLIGIGVPALWMIATSPLMAVRPDYVFYSAPLIFALAAYACDQTRLALAGRTAVGHVLTAAILLSMMPETVSYYTDKLSLDLREGIRVVEQNYRPGDRIVSFVDFKRYAQSPHALEPYPGAEFDSQVAWKDKLQRYEQGGDRVWFLIRLRREPLAPGLEGWLLDHASLVWRKTSKRYDYSVMGYQVFLYEPGCHACRRAGDEERE